MNVIQTKPKRKRFSFLKFYLQAKIQKIWYMDSFHHSPEPFDVLPTKESLNNF
jgi:hypothetical protein